MFYVMIAINILYVTAEFIFNFILLNTASTQVNLDDIHSVEILGRSLAAFGFTFIFWKIIQGLNTSTKNKMIFILLSSLISYPLFYFGQEKLINHLAENSSLETREKMNSIFILKTGLINGSLQLDTVPYNESVKDLPESKTFITNISLFMLNNDKVLNYIKKNQDQIASAVFTADVMSKPHVYLDSYSKAVIKITEEFNNFSAASKNLDIKNREVSKLVNANYNNLMRYLNAKYKRERKYYEYSGMSFIEYTRTMNVQNDIKRNIKKSSGFDVYGLIDVSSASSMKNSIMNEDFKIYNETISKKEKEFGIKFPQGLTHSHQFLNHPEGQKLLEKELGPIYAPVKFEYSSFIYKNNEDLEKIRNNAGIIGPKLGKEFLNKDINSSESISMVKAMIVPPIALLLSLLFAFINLFILIKTLIDKIIKDKKLISNGIVLALVILLFSLPMLLSNKYTESVSYKKVFVHVQNYNVVLAGGVHWIMKFEPFVYGYGSLFIKK